MDWGKHEYVFYDVTQTARHKCVVNVELFYYILDLQFTFTCTSRYALILVCCTMVNHGVIIHNKDYYTLSGWSCYKTC